MASRPVLFSQVRLFHREVNANALSTQLVRCSVRITFDSEGVASGLSHQPLSGGKGLVSSSVPSPERSILGVERCHLPSPDQRHSVFTLLGEDRRSGPSHLPPRFYCFTAVAGPRLFSPTPGCWFSKKHISTSARPSARRQRTREVTAHPAATATSTQVQAGVPGCTRWGVTSSPDRPPPHLRIAEATAMSAAQRTRGNPCAVRQQRAHPYSHIPRQGDQSWQQSTRQRTLPNRRRES
jgi:hypothetical protein